MTTAATAVAGLLVAALFTGCEPGTTAAQHAASSAPPMEALIESVRDRDTTRFLSFFSREQPWRYVSTIESPPDVAEVTYRELERDLKSKTGWYETLFDNDGDDCFRDWFEGNEGAMWKPASPTRFVRHTANGRHMVYVEWQKEGDRWVLHTIAEPSA